MPPQDLTTLAKSFAIKKLPGSEVEITGDLPAETVAPYREAALKHLAEHVEMPGFRAGHVPPDMILKKVGEVGVLEEAVELCMQDLYLPLIQTHKIDAVGRPDIRVTRLAPGNPISLVIRTAVYPPVTLPKNWKTVGESVAREPFTGELPKMAVPPSAEDEQKAREYLAKDTRRGKIIDALLEKVEVEIPSVFVDSELDKIMAQMQEDIARFKIPYDEYLKRVGKTEEQMREDFREQARKRAKLQLTLNKIAEEEKIEADTEAVETEIKHAIEHFPNAKPELLRIHIETVLRNEKILQMLEGENK